MLRVNKQKKYGCKHFDLFQSSLLNCQSCVPLRTLGVLMSFREWISVFWQTCKAVKDCEMFRGIRMISKYRKLAKQCKYPSFLVISGCAHLNDTGKTSTKLSSFPSRNYESGHQHCRS